MLLRRSKVIYINPVWHYMISKIYRKGAVSVADQSLSVRGLHPIQCNTKRSYTRTALRLDLMTYIIHNLTMLQNALSDGIFFEGKGYSRSPSTKTMPHPFYIEYRISCNPLRLGFIQEQLRINSEVFVALT